MSARSPKALLSCFHAHIHDHSSRHSRRSRLQPEVRGRGMKYAVTPQINKESDGGFAAAHSTRHRVVRLSATRKSYVYRLVSGDRNYCVNTSTLNIVFVLVT